MKQTLVAVVLLALAPATALAGFQDCKDSCHSTRNACVARCGNDQACVNTCFDESGKCAAVCENTYPAAAACDSDCQLHSDDEYACEANCPDNK